MSSDKKIMLLPRATRSVFLLLLVVLVLIPTSGWAEDARAIMQKVLDRNDGTTEISRQQLSTCRYGIKGKKIVCAETPRVKVMESVRKDYGEKEKDKRAAIILRDPPGQRGIGFLQYDYDDASRDTDQWMYLSALGKVKRIVSGSEDEPKEGSFFGSEFGYEDMEQVHIDDFTYRVVREDDEYHNRSCWVIEMLPTPKKARKSNYSKTISWIDKKNYLILKSLLYDRRGRKTKRISTKGLEQVDGIWIAREMSVNNLQTKRISTFKLQEIAFNVSVEDAFLTQRTLTDGAFRENHLQKLRQYLK